MARGPITKRPSVKASLRLAQRTYVEGDDPLKYLLPWEQKAAELYVRLGAIPELTNKQGLPYSDEFHTQFWAEMPMLPKRTYLTGLRLNPAWLAYVKYLRDHAREAVLGTLHNTATRAVDNYLWAQEAARKAEDYKETRMASADHLDRIGATEKPPTTTVQVANIQLHSRNFTAADLLAPSPELEGEVINERPSDNSDK